MRRNPVEVTWKLTTLAVMIIMIAPIFVIVSIIVALHGLYSALFGLHLLFLPREGL